MVGDGQNDYYALFEANIGVLTIAQSPIESDYLIEASNYIISDIIELLNLLNLIFYIFIIFIFSYFY